VANVAKMWQAGETLILACPSRSNPGTYYLIKVYRNGNCVVVEHVCPATNAGRTCWHIKEAARIYKEWCGEELEYVVAVSKPVLFRKGWQEKRMREGRYGFRIPHF